MGTNNRQGELWGTAPEDWALYLEISFIPLYKKIISKSGLSSSCNVLDIGCGSGLFMKMAGAKGAKTIGIDVSNELLNVARQRNPSSLFLNCEMEQLSFDDERFNLVTCFNSLQYSNDISAVLKKIKSVLVENGKLAIGIWGSPEECEALNVLASVASLFPEPPAGSPGPLALSDEKKLEDLLLSSGFEITEKDTIECPWYFSSLNEALKGILAAGPSVEAINYAGKEKVKEKLVTTLSAYNLTGEIYVMDNVFHYFIAG